MFIGKKEIEFRRREPKTAEEKAKISRGVKDWWKNQNTKLKDYAAGAILTTAAWQLGGKKAYKASNFLIGKSLKTKPGKFVSGKASVLADKILDTKPLKNTGFAAKSNRDLTKAAAASSLFLIPGSIAAYKGTQSAGKALGWAVDKNREKNDGKIKIKLRY